MRTGYIFVFVTSFLLMLATSHCEDPENVSKTHDFQQKKSVNDRTFEARRGLQFHSSTLFPATLRNQGLASVGGPAHDSKTASAINGTGIKHKP